MKPKKLKLTFSELEKELSSAEIINLHNYKGGFQPPNTDCFYQSFGYLYEKAFGGTTTVALPGGYSTDPLDFYREVYIDLYGVSPNPNPGAGGADSLVAYNTLLANFDNVSATTDMDQIFAAGSSYSNNLGVIINCVGDEYGTGHSVVVTETFMSASGSQMLRIRDEQNNITYDRSVAYMREYINSAFIVGSQDSYNQSTDPLKSPNYETNWGNIFGTTTTN